MKISSPGFMHNQMLPKKFTCQGKGVSPCLMIEDIPEKTKSLVLIVDDPDAPGKTFVHWVVYNIPPVEKIEEGEIPGIQGKNSIREENFVPACPPFGVHRYFFKIYALSEKLSFPSPPTKTEVEIAMKKSLLASAEMVGLYEKI